MPSKLQTYMQMADEAQRQITGSYRGWTGFLTTAARLYKYPYAEQVMIHAQRPDATACAEYDFWNEKMGRYVRRGSKGIALIDSSGERPRLRYVFDVSDTGGREFPKSRYLWEYREEHADAVSAMLESRYGVDGKGGLSYAEIKALCAGDKRIKEKMDLDVDVARLKLMKASHQSQQFRLEDNLLRHFPEQIRQNESFVEGFTADMQTLAGHPHPVDGFAGMEVKGDLLTDKDNAGAAILEAFKDAKGMEPVPIGSYRGFAMSLTVENFGKDFILTLKGRMSHRVELPPNCMQQQCLHHKCRGKGKRDLYKHVNP